MHIGLTYDLQTDPTDWRQAEFDPPRTVDALRRALESLGHHVTPIGGAAALLKAGSKRWCDIDLVFNITEAGEGRNREACVPTLLELFRVPYVGSDPLALSVGLDKLMCKRLAKAEGLRTPAWAVVDRAGEAPKPGALRFPMIVKPRYEGSGIGIEPGAVVRTPVELSARLCWGLERFRQPLLVEEFIEHGELTVCLTGNAPPRAWPVIQRPLDPTTRLSRHVASSTNHAASSADASAWVAPIELSPELEREAADAARRMFEALGCRDMARVDFRVDADGRLFFLEINPLPSFDPEGSFGLLAEHAGVTYADLIGEILDAAFERFGLLSKRTRA